MKDVLYVQSCLQLTTQVIARTDITAKSMTQTEPSSYEMLTVHGYSLTAMSISLCPLAMLITFVLQRRRRRRQQ